jgi:hypothetical protein
MHGIRLGFQVSPIAFFYKIPFLSIFKNGCQVVTKAEYNRLITKGKESVYLAVNKNGKMSNKCLCATPVHS